MEVKINEKTYIIEYTRDSICKSESAFGLSMLQLKDPESMTDTMALLKTLLYGALIKNQPKIKPEDMGDIYDEFVSEDGFEQEALIVGLVDMIKKTISPTGGKRRKKLM